MSASCELALQRDLFTGEWIGVGTKQKRPQSVQMALFSVQETVQYGVSARPWLKNVPQAPLTLEIQDVRTDEEKERDRQRAAAALTTPLFAEPKLPPAAQPEPSALVDDDAPEYRVALFHLGKAELLASRPDLQEQIRQLTDTEIEAIACQAEEALQSVYQMVLGLCLMSHLAHADGHSLQVSPTPPPRPADALGPLRAQSTAATVPLVH